MPSPPTAQSSEARLAGGSGVVEDEEESLAGEPAAPPEPEPLGSELACPVLPGAAPPLPAEEGTGTLPGGSAEVPALPPAFGAPPGAATAGPGSAAEPPRPPEAVATISELDAGRTPGER
jgi:hypothetical protein